MPCTDTRVPSLRPRVAFGYTHGGEDDTDWGCVYRSAQNVQAYTGLRVWKVRSLSNYIGRQWGSWAEPADFVPLFQKAAGFRVRALLVGGPSTAWLKYTSIRQYQRVSFADFRWNLRASYIVDDGISGYAVVSHGNKHWFIDPHTATPRPVPLKRQLAYAPGWMMLEVLPPSPTKEKT